GDRGGRRAERHEVAFADVRGHGQPLPARSFERKGRRGRDDGRRTRRDGDRDSFDRVRFHAHPYRGSGPGLRENGSRSRATGARLFCIGGQKGRINMTPDVTTNHLAAVYLVYAGASLGLTIWLARTL